MPALNFKAEFADDVEEGRKRRSIRAPRKDGLDIKKGDKLFLYTGMRQPSCRKLGEAVVTRVRQVEIDHMGIKIEGRSLYAGDTPAYHGSPDADYYEGDFARADGFDSFQDMKDWFAKQHGLPFHGNLIEWSDAPIQPHT